MMDILTLGVLEGREKAKVICSGNQKTDTSKGYHFHRECSL